MLDLKLSTSLHLGWELLGIRDSSERSEATFASIGFDMEEDTVFKFSKGNKSGCANAKFEQQTMTNIRVPHEHDVLMGRGGKNNQHSGNEKLRCLARDRCAAYRRATKKDKSDLSRELVRLMRALDPPARFLRKDPDTCLWEDVGDHIAREKASQVLRDAVSEKNGPMSQVRNTSTLKSEPNFTENSDVEDETDYDPIPIRLSLREAATSSVAGALGSNSPYIFGQAGFQDRPDPSASCNYPRVTPASDQVARKRPRIFETPSERNYGYSSPIYPSPHARSVRRQHSLSQTIFPSFPANSPNVYSYPIYHDDSAVAPRYMPEEAAIPEHYVSQVNRNGAGGNEPWVSRTNSRTHTSTASDVGGVRLHMHNRDFDPFGEDVLSDHSNHGERSHSPIVYPRRDPI